jgi:hypothetical protein
MKVSDISTRLRHTITSQSNKRVYWVIGLKTITNAKYKSGHVREDAEDGELDIPVGPIVTGASGVPLGKTGNLEAKYLKKSRGKTAGSGKLEGERVFAVQYCPVKLVRQAGANILNWKKTEPKMGPPKDFSDREGLSFYPGNLEIDEEELEEEEEEPEEDEEEPEEEEEEEVVLDAVASGDTELAW